MLEHKGDSIEERKVFCTDSGLALSASISWEQIGLVEFSLSGSGDFCF